MPTAAWESDAARWHAPSVTSRAAYEHATKGVFENRFCIISKTRSGKDLPCLATNFCTISANRMKNDSLTVRKVSHVDEWWKFALRYSPSQVWHSAHHVFSYSKQREVSTTSLTQLGNKCPFPPRWLVTSYLWVISKRCLWFWRLECTIQAPVESLRVYSLCLL